MKSHKNKHKTSFWTHEEVRKADKILSSEEKKKKHFVYFKHRNQIVYWSVLLILLISSLVISVVLIPFLMVLDTAFIYLIIAIFGLGFGRLNRKTPPIKVVHPSTKMIASGMNGIRYRISFKPRRKRKKGSTSRKPRAINAAPIDLLKAVYLMENITPTMKITKSIARSHKPRGNKIVVLLWDEPVKLLINSDITSPIEYLVEHFKSFSCFLHQLKFVIRKDGKNAIETSLFRSLSTFGAKSNVKININYTVKS